MGGFLAFLIVLYFFVFAGTILASIVALANNIQEYPGAVMLLSVLLGGYVGIGLISLYLLMKINLLL